MKQQIERLRELQAKVVSIGADIEDFDGDKRGMWFALGEAEEELAKTAISFLPHLLSALDEAVEALRPFAYAAFEADGYPDSEAFTLVLRDDDFDGLADGSEEKESLITARQIRTARAFIEKYGRE